MNPQAEIAHVIEQLSSINTSTLTIKERISLFNQLSDIAAEVVRFDHPVLNVRLVKANHVQNNDYNPNAVAPPEYRLLKHSIKSDGLTMPVVVGRVMGEDDYVIIDGAHRAQIIKTDPVINASLANYIPVVILEKSLDERISASIRHNMARGAHQIELTASLVIKLKEMAWTNNEIGKELGMDADEVLRMQQITGLADAFKNNTFSKAWD